MLDMIPNYPEFYVLLFMCYFLYDYIEPIRYWCRKSGSSVWQEFVFGRGGYNLTSEAPQAPRLRHRRHRGGGR